MPSKEEILKEMDLYRSYYEKVRRETGTPSIYEVFWSGALSGVKMVETGSPNEMVGDWMQAPLCTRQFSKENAYKDMVGEMHACVSCGLHQSREHAVPSSGPLRAELMIVGEAPGAEEDKTGVPFVGRAGELLDELLLTYMGKHRDKVFVANCVKCRPPGNREPAAEEKEACRHFLHRQICLVSPKMILCVGKHAASWFVGTPPDKLTIKELHGKILWYEHVPLMIMPHPAAYLRDKDKWHQPTVETLGWSNWILEQPYDADLWSKETK